MVEHNDPLSRRTEIFGIPFADMAKYDEQDRIMAWGNLLQQKPVNFKIAMLVDEEGKDGYEKADRYIRTFVALFPSMRVKFEKRRGPSQGCITITSVRTE